MSRLGQLPGELISSILNRINDNDLHACTLINKIFYKIANPVLWRRLDIGDSTTFTTIATAMATSLSSPGEHVRHIILRASFSLTDTELSSVIKYVPFLETLTLPRFQEHITDTSLQHIPHYCRRLTHLTIECRYESRPVGPTQRTISALGTFCHQLLYIKLESCRDLDSGLFSALACCPFIETLIVDSCELADMTNDPYAVQLAAMHVATMTHLKKLKLWYQTFDHTVFLTTMQDDHTAAWPHLTSLSLYICPTLDNPTAIAFIDSHPHLQHLEFRDSLITDATLDAIIEYLPGMSVIVLDWSMHVTAAGLHRLMTTTQLRQVDVFGCGLFLQDFLDLSSPVHRHLVVTNEDLNHQVGSQEELDEDENQVVRLYKGVFDEVT